MDKSDRGDDISIYCCIPIPSSERYPKCGPRVALTSHGILSPSLRAVRSPHPAVSSLSLFATSESRRSDAKCPNTFEDRHGTATNSPLCRTLMTEGMVDLQDLDSTRDVLCSWYSFDLRQLKVE